MQFFSNILGKSKILFSLLVPIFSLSFCSYVQGKSAFFDSLEKIGFTEESFREKKEISRYDLARILNIIDCQDCFIPNDWTKQYYSEKYWNDFVKNPDNNFNDIQYLGAKWAQRSYYYCVAYVGDQQRQYMRGYPISSTICKEAFCGNNSTSKADFFQVVLNIIQPKLWDHYTPNWANIYQWYKNLSKDSLSYLALSEESKEIYSATPQRVGIHSKKEFQAYLSYCMYNLGECGFLPQGNLKQGAWPISEVNVLLREGIITTDNLSGLLSPIGGAEVLDIFDVIFSQYSACEFDFDYDCDGINNIVDNCVYDYNPSQMDLDADGVGDVCDVTIDGKNLNPFGIVDDHNHIILSRLIDGGRGENGAGKNGNNTDLEFLNDTTNNGKFFLSVESIDQNLPSRVVVSVDTDEKIKTIHRQWGDTQTTDSSSLKLSHTYQNKGKYLITATAITTQGKQLTASLEVYLGVPKNQQYALEIKSIFSSTRAAFSAIYSGNLDKATWTFDDGVTKTVGISENVVHVFEKDGIHFVQVKGYEKGVLKAVASTTIKVVNKSSSSQGRGKTVALKVVSKPLGTPSQFTTILNGINQNEISMIKWIFEPGVEEYGTELYKEHRFPHSGIKTVQQILTLTSGEKFTTTITFYLDNPLINFFCASKVHRSYQQNNVNSVLETLLCPQNESVLTHLENNVTKEGNSVSYTYYTLGEKNIVTNFRINSCVDLKNQGEILVGKIGDERNQTEQDQCYALWKKGTLNKVYHCDMDKDGIPDICDDDIDGDGKKNLLGLILYENPDCSYHVDDIDETGKNGKNQNGIGNNLNVQIFLRSFGVCSLDNCTFDFNPLQEDLNNNGVGDICEGRFNVDALLQKFRDGTLEMQGIDDTDNSGLADQNSNGTISSLGKGKTFMKDDDTDGDGIYDSQDQCPGLPGPEKWNGCPFYGSIVKDNLISNTVWTLVNTDSAVSSTLGVSNTNSSNLNSSLGITQGILQRSPLCDDNDFGENSCGDGKIDPGENCRNCPQDVGGPCVLCPDGIQEPGENCENCPEDSQCPSLCGNGKKDSGEECDEGKGRNGKTSCRIDCKKFDPDQPLCGNGVIDEGERCENCAVDLGSICIKKVVCGDGEQEGNEECDEGEKNGEDGINCTKECKKKSDCGENGCPVSCGNGVKELLEECDAGEHNGEDAYNCTKECTFIYCGNGRQDRGEICDDGEKNGTSLSKCTDKCKLKTCGNGKKDPNETCETCPEDVGACPKLCGNKQLDLGEVCDWSIVAMEKNCTKECKLTTCGNGKNDSYETCKNCPQDLGKICDKCGNGQLDEGENCDVCSEDLGDVCIGVCGDGYLDQTEECDYGKGNNGLDNVNCTVECKEKMICTNGKEAVTEKCKECQQKLGEKCSLEDSKCGDGVCSLNERCTDCPSDCGICQGLCGNGKKEANEPCDPEHPDYKDKGICTVDCVLLTCGDGEKQDWEECDLGGENGIFENEKSCTIACTYFDPEHPDCGDGEISADEDCPLCPIDLGKKCDSICGDHKQTAGEECDEGDMNGKGVCSNACKIDTPTPGPTCGNGTCEEGEGCEECPMDCGWCILPNCNSCPCEYADYKNDLTDTDKIYAILRNRGLKILYNQSEGVMLSDFGL